MSNHDLFFFITMGIGVSVFFGCLGYNIYTANKETLRLRKERYAREDKCLCKHERWYHHSTVAEPLNTKCFQFKEPGDKLVLCGCLRFKRDNLLYLEKLVERG